MRFNLKFKEDVEYINNVYAKMSAVIGIENAKKLFTEYRGQQITFPIEFYKKEYVYHQIVDEYDGTNVKQLAQKYGYCEHTIRRIIRENKAIKDNK